MNLIQQVEAIIQDQFKMDSSGHDWNHIDRVRRMALFIQKTEGGDPEIIELIALLHDISDHKLNGGILNNGGTVAREVLTALNVDSQVIDIVSENIDKISFKGAKTPTKEIDLLECKIVQDADRLDAIGAIGIGRTFAYGGHKGNLMFDGQLDVTMHDSFEEYAKGNGTTIEHFYEKLLLLKDLMNTDTAKEIATERHAFMELFLKQFFHEWNINKVEKV